MSMVKRVICVDSVFAQVIVRLGYIAEMIHVGGSSALPGELCVLLEPPPIESHGAIRLPDIVWGDRRYDGGSTTLRKVSNGVLYVVVISMYDHGGAVINDCSGGVIAIADRVAPSVVRVGGTIVMTKLDDDKVSWFHCVVEGSKATFIGIASGAPPSDSIIDHGQSYILCQILAPTICATSASTFRHGRVASHVDGLGGNRNNTRK